MTQPATAAELRRSALLVWEYNKVAASGEMRRSHLPGTPDEIERALAVVCAASRDPIGREEFAALCPDEFRVLSDPKRTADIGKLCMALPFCLLEDEVELERHRTETAQNAERWKRLTERKLEEAERLVDRVRAIRWSPRKAATVSELPGALALTWEYSAIVGNGRFLGSQLPASAAEIERALAVIWAALRDPVGRAEFALTYPQDFQKLNDQKVFDELNKLLSAIPSFRSDEEMQLEGRRPGSEALAQLNLRRLEEADAIRDRGATLRWQPTLSVKANVPAQTGSGCALVLAVPILITAAAVAMSR